MTIWKFNLPVEDAATVPMPEGAKVLCVQVQYGQPCLWAVVDESRAPTPRRFRVAGTGHDLGVDPAGYVGTFQLFEGRLVFHVFEVAADAA